MYGQNSKHVRVCGSIHILTWVIFHYKRKEMLMKFILNTIYTVRWIFKGETYYTRAMWVDSFVVDGTTVLVMERVGKKKDGQPIYYFFDDAQLQEQVCAPTELTEYEV